MFSQGSMIPSASAWDQLVSGALPRSMELKLAPSPLLASSVPSSPKTSCPVPWDWCRIGMPSSLVAPTRISWLPGMMVRRLVAGSAVKREISFALGGLF